MWEAHGLAGRFRYRRYHHRHLATTTAATAATAATVAPRTLAQAIKHLTSVDGGLILLPNAELYRRARLLRWFGIDRERRSGGGSSRMT